MDCQQNSVIGENDLSSLIISASPSDLPGTLTLSWGSNIKLWETANKDTEVTKTTYTASELPKTYYVEGYNPSNSLKDTQITLSYTAPDNTQYQDTAKITVYDIGIDDPVIVQYIPKPSTGNPYYIIQAHMRPPDAFEGKLYWSWQDPSPTNQGEAPVVYFQQTGNWDFHSGTQPYSIPDSSGIVKCRFNLYNGAGDDGIVKVSTQPSGYGEGAISAKMIVVGVNISIDNLSEQAEVETGSYIFLNWDDDNDNNTCDMNETGSVSNENDVIPFNLEIIPSNTKQGVFELSVIQGDSKVKIWKFSNKGSQITLPETWILPDEEVPETLYIEGVEKSGSERDIVVRLKYTNTVNGTDKTTQDTVILTVVRLNLGIAVYRELDTNFWWRNRGHAGLIYKYTGARLRNDIRSETNYWVIQETNADDRITQQNFYQWQRLNNREFWGKYVSPYLTDTQRMRIVKNAKYVWDNRSSYYYVLTDVVNSDWDRTSISTATYMRCDGLVEVCYELAGCNVWGKIVSGNTHYNISYSDAYRDEHNETHGFDFIEWEQYLYPATQCGHESGERGTSWNTTFTTEPFLYEPNF